MTITFTSLLDGIEFNVRLSPFLFLYVGIMISSENLSGIFLGKSFKDIFL